MGTSFLPYINHSLCFGEKSTKLQSLVRDGDGPSYVYDLSQIAARLFEMRSAVPGAKLFYAVKANSHLDVLRKLREGGAGADVVSGGEITRALQAGFAPSEIIYSGVGKTEREIELALKKNILQINVESRPELERIGRLARHLGVKARVAFRMNPDVSIETHPYIATGLAENKFGMELSQIPFLEESLSRFSDSLILVGISLHLGSQMLEFSGLREALQRLKPVYFDLRKRHPDLNCFDAGGGLGILYEEDSPAKESALLQEYAAVLREVLSDVPGNIQLEPGRWLVAHAGVLLTQVQYVKETSGRTFVIIDSGMNHLIRPALYEAHHRILPLEQNFERMPKVVDVVGPICESADFLAKQRSLPEVQEGEWIAIADAGAYGFSMANTYNLQDLPREIVL